MLEKLTHHDFAAYLEQVFALKAEQEALPLTLTQVKRLRQGIQEGDRDQFSLLFKGPAGPVLPQRIYELSHEVMGVLSLFLVPIGREQGRNQDPTRPVLYEAIFT